MSRFGAGNSAAATRCALCDFNGAIWEVWGVNLCPTHHAKWIGDDRFSSGTINAALGLSDSPDAFTPAGHARYCAEAEKRTREWVTEQRKARAA